MKKYLVLTLIISVLVGILLPLTVGVKDLTHIAIIFCSVWAIYLIILFGYVFLVEGRPYRNRLNRKKEEDPFPHHLIQEWEALWEITAGKHKEAGPKKGNPNWN